MDYTTRFEAVLDGTAEQVQSALADELNLLSRYNRRGKIGENVWSFLQTYGALFDDAQYRGMVFLARLYKNMATKPYEKELSEDTVRFLVAAANRLYSAQKAGVI